ncbi:glycosyltransferase family 4 protein [Candidatus Saccharibacteria bacterium]|nr:MAG: glycosyltransferase family 4 protein [Candidatus Saccharibacteria bacterium]
MKIGLVCPYSIAKGGGVQEVVKALQREYIKLGHEAIIITPQPKEPFTNRDHKVVFIGTSTDFKAAATTTQISASMLTDEIDSILEYEKFDVLHFHEPWIPVLSRQILSRSQCPNVATFHAKLPETIASRALAKVIIPYTKPLLKHIDAYTAVSNAAAEYVRSLTDAEIQIIPNGIHTGHFRRPAHAAQVSHSGKTILYIGRLEKRKGVNYLLQAFKLLQERQPDVRLVIAGDGVDKEKLEELAEQLEVKQVSFYGYIDDRTKLELLHAADLFCSPAIYGESFGIVLLEAMASGLVTIAGNNSGYESVMTGLGQLSLVDPRDSKEFAHRMELLLNDSGIRDLWIKWAKKHVRQFEYHKVAAMYLASYERAIKELADNPRRKREDWLRS